MSKKFDFAKPPNYFESSSLAAALVGSVKYRLHCAFYCVLSQQNFFLRWVTFSDESTIAVLNDRIQTIRRRIGEEF